MLNRGTYSKQLKKKNKRGIGVGTSMVLVVFVLFCLITFATLSYVTARADYSKTVEGVESLSDYYQAVSNIETQISEIDLLGVSEGIVYNFSEPIDDDRTLNVTLITTGDKDKPFKVKQWSTTNNTSGVTFDEKEGMNLLF